jgi:hypothetical protein
MDRDMVNCLHYLYQWQHITGAQLDEPDKEKRLFWCRGDTNRPLLNRKIVREDVASGELTLDPGVYDLIDMIEAQLRSMPKPDFAFGYPFSAAIRPRGSIRPAFLAIPYRPEFEPIKQAVKDAGKAARYQCEVTGDLANPGNIMDQVWTGIRGADAVVADITGANANVYYEIGMAQALGKEIILISQEQDAPFDIRASRRIDYHASDLHALGKKLEEAFVAISARYPHEGDEPRF